MNNAVKTMAALAVVALAGSAAFAQAPPPPPPPHQGIFSKLFHPKPKPGMAPPMRPGSMHPGMMPHSGTGYPGTGYPGHTGSMPFHSPMGGHPGMMGGQIIGNKNSHVYHMPGDNGSLPSPQNRVYFRSAAAAQAAGYHAAGGHGMTRRSRPLPNGGPTMLH